MEAWSAGTTLPPVPGVVDAHDKPSEPDKPPPRLEAQVCEQTLTQAELLCKDGEYDIEHTKVADQVKSGLASAILEMRETQAQQKKLLVDLMGQHEHAVVNAVREAVARLMDGSRPNPPPVQVSPPPPALCTEPPSLEPFAAGVKAEDKPLTSGKPVVDSGSNKKVVKLDVDEETNPPFITQPSIQSNLSKKIFANSRKSMANMTTNVHKARLSKKVSTKKGGKNSFQSKIDNVLKNQTGNKYTLKSRSSATTSMRNFRDRVNKGMTVGTGIRDQCKRLVFNEKFDAGIMGVILFNSMLLGLQIDHTAEFGRDSPGLKPFEVAEVFFLIIFIMEWLLRIVAEGKDFFLGPGKVTHCMDTIIVLSGILEQLLMAAFGGADSMEAFATLRILRLLRLGRSARLLDFSDDLRALVLGLVYSIRSLLWAVLFLNMLMFVYCVMVIEFTVDYFPGGRYGPPRIPENATELEGHIEGSSYYSPMVKGDTMAHSGHVEELQWYFGNLPRGMLTLFRCISGGIDWGDVAEPLKHVSWPMVIVFSVFIGCCVFAVLNIITCIFIENAKKLAMRDQSTLIMEEMKERSWLTDTLRTMFAKADTNDSGVLEWEEFQECFEDPIVQGYFRRLGIDIEACGVRSLWEIFDFDDTGKVDVETFVVGTLHLQGGAKAIDIHRLRMDIEDVQSRLDLANHSAGA